MAVLLGRPNVGKSSLFNRLTASREALVGEEEGLTRDLRFGPVSWPSPQRHSAAEPDIKADILVVDTGGLSSSGGHVQQSAAQRSWEQAARADLVLLLTDAAVGPTGFDEEVLSRLRQQGRPIQLIANKADLANLSQIHPDHAALGLGEPLAVSARTGRGMAQLRQRLYQMTAELGQKMPALEPAAGSIVLTGRPNAGKSTLLNALCTADRALVSDEPGTTRDDVEADFFYDGSRYRLVDTAGVQRRWQNAPPGQALAAARSLARLQRAQVILHLVDARIGPLVQDQRLIGRALDEGCTPLLVLTKSDELDANQRRECVRYSGLDFAPFVSHCLISAHTGRGMDQLRAKIGELIADSHRTLGTAQVNRVLQRLLSQHPPPTQRGRRPKLRYAHPMAGEPIKIRIFGTACERVPDSYRRYLEKAFGEALGGLGNPVRVILRSVDNPYAPGRSSRRRKGS